MSADEEHSKDSVARDRVTDELTWAVRELTANLMRITRGAGKPYEVMQQMGRLAQAVKASHTANGVWPFLDEFSQALDVTKRYDGLKARSADEREFAEDRIVRGALQIAASRLLGQRTQEAIGENQLYDGLIAIEKIREEGRQAYMKLLRIMSQLRLSQ